MKSIKRWTIVMIGVLAFAPSSFARESHKAKEGDRLRDAAAVMTEILNVPDNIPHD
jgi:hypothetical protein